MSPMVDLAKAICRRLQILLRPVLLVREVVHIEQILLCLFHIGTRPDRQGILRD